MFSLLMLSNESLMIDWLGLGLVFDSVVKFSGIS